MQDFDKFKELLAEQMNFPDYYVFKFIILSDKKQTLIEVLEGHKIEERASQNGKYVSITSRKLVHHPDDVVDVYLEVGKLEGIITL